MRRSGAARFTAYLLLIAGAILFALPFVWLISTSMKLDRELFSGHLDLIPEAPRPRDQSPYFDERQFPEAEQQQLDLLAPLIKRRIEACRGRLPAAVAGVDRDELLMRGILQSIVQRAPAAVWNDSSALLRFAEIDVDRDRIVQTAERCLREIRLGSIRLRDDATMETDTPVADWGLATGLENTLPYAAWAYNFAGRDHIQIHTTLELPFEPMRLQRLQLRIRPDDTWHELQMFLDCGGVRYAGERAEPLADNQWTTLAWQMPGPDDRSTKIKSWIVLEEVGRGSQFDPGPRAARITLQISKSSRLGAMFAKARYNYQRVLDRMPFWRYVRISLLLVLLNIVLTLLTSSLVAYAFARIQWPGRDFAFVLLLATMMIPGQVTMIPNFLIWKSLGAYNTLVPLWAGAALGNAFFIFLMRQFLRGVPRDLEDAARIDGCGFLRTWWHVMLPLVKPSLAAIAIFTFIGTWNDFLGPLIYIADQRLYPLAFGLYAFAVHVGSNPVLTMSASVLMTIPVVAVFFIAQRYFIQGITLTGMKG